MRFPCICGDDIIKAKKFEKITLETMLDFLNAKCLNGSLNYMENGIIRTKKQGVILNMTPILNIEMQARPS